MLMPCTLCSLSSPADPNMAFDMMKGMFTNMLPMIVIGGWINWTFSGFITSEFPWQHNHLFDFSLLPHTCTSLATITYPSSLPPSLPPSFPFHSLPPLPPLPSLPPSWYTHTCTYIYSPPPFSFFHFSLSPYLVRSPSCPLLPSYVCTQLKFPSP